LTRSEGPDNAGRAGGYRGDEALIGAGTAKARPDRPAGQPPAGDFDHDATLLACGKGDSAAFRALYDREAGKMLGIAMRLLKRQSLAEDAVHDAFVNVWNKAATFDPAQGNARGWMYTILRNRALNMLRTEGRLDHQDAFETLLGAAPDEDPEAIVAGLSEASALRRCLEGLAPNRRSVLVLAYVHGLTHGEIAGRLGVPLGTMKSWVRRSLLALKECMG
jgi:RNA polymerase sigma-70 factor (ECF subfamily)